MLTIDDLLRAEHLNNAYKDSPKYRQHISIEPICNICGDIKILYSGPHSITCDLAGNYIECPPDCKGTGGCHPQPQIYKCLKCDNL